MKSVNILSICGSGTITSSMVAAKLKDRLSEHGYQVKCSPRQTDRGFKSGAVKTL